MRTNPSRPEPVNSTGAVLLGYNQLALLHGLYDRPDGRAESSADLVRAAIPYVRIYRAPNWGCLSSSVLSLHPAWVKRGRSGRRNTWQLEPRGRAIVERSVQAWLRGMGPYEGLSVLLEATKERRREEHVDARIEAMQHDHDGRELLARIECAIFAWSCYFGPTGFCSAIAHERNKRVLRSFLQCYVVRHGAMPDGIHDVGDLSLHPSRVDFDLLVGPLPWRGGKAVLVNTSRHIIVRASSNFDVARLRELARAGAEWRDNGLLCEPTVVPDVLHALYA
jgi:hypothetical protein